MTERDINPTLRIVVISDTHNDHAALNVPDGDVLIHAGDFTSYGRLEHAVSFNDWLGTLPHAVKIVVNGNHENNAPWKAEVKSIITNAIFLRNEAYTIPNGSAQGVKIYGTDFSWPLREGRHPMYEAIDDDVSIIISHGPAAGYVDLNNGCPALLARCSDIASIRESRLRLVIGGHIHNAYGVAEGRDICSKIRFINASSCGEYRKVEHDPIVVDLNL